MSSGLDIVNIAQREIGFVEGPNNESKYGQWYGADHEPYCAMFVSYVFNQAGLSGLIAAQSPKGFAYCPTGLTWFQKRGQVLPKGQGRAGDIIFYDFSGRGVAEHVGIIENCSASGITTIEGNTSPDHAVGSQANGNGVYRRHRPWLNVMAVVRPNYPTPLTSSVPTKHKVIASGVAGATALGGGSAAVMNSTNSSPINAPTASIVAPQYPGINALKIGYKGPVATIVETALAKAGLLPENLVTGVLSMEDIALVPVYQSLYEKLKNEKGLTQATYNSMVVKAGQ